VATPAGSDVDGRNLTRLGVDPRDGVVERVGNPHRVGISGRWAGARAQSDLRSDRAAIGVDEADSVLGDGAGRLIVSRNEADHEQNAGQPERGGDRQRGYSAQTWAGALSGGDRRG
jgi:hypothetical protein